MQKKKARILVIHGGMTFRSKDRYLHYLRTRKISLANKISWTDLYLDKKLGKDLEIIRPKMPLKENASYTDWKIHLERFLPYLDGNMILIGKSLGATFLAKYLSENRLKKKILATYLVGPPFDNSLPGEDLAGGFRLGKDLSLIEKNSKKTYLMFSEDDPVVPLSHAEKYKKKLPNSQVIIYKSKNGHFQVEEFPEIVRMIRDDVKKQATNLR